MAGHLSPVAPVAESVRVRIVAAHPVRCNDGYRLCYHKNIFCGALRRAAAPEGGLECIGRGEGHSGRRRNLISLDTKCALRPDQDVSGRSSSGADNCVRATQRHVRRVYFLTTAANASRNSGPPPAPQLEEASCNVGGRWLRDSVAINHQTAAVAAHVQPGIARKRRSDGRGRGRQEIFVRLRASERKSCFRAL